jgi:hypothetical protein
MRIRLNISSQTSLIDHSIESVLPGVHSRLAALHSDVTGVKKGQDVMAEGILALKNSIEDRDEQLGEALRTIATGVDGRARASFDSEDSSSPSPRRRGRILALAATTSPNNLPSTAPQLRPRHSSIYEAYYEWNGLEMYSNKPVPGGFAQLEAEFGCKWRAHFNPAQGTYVGRLKKVMQGIDAMLEDEVEQEGGSEDDYLSTVLDKVEMIFVNEKKSIPNLSKWFQSQGLVKKGNSRGKHSSINV